MEWTKVERAFAVEAYFSNSCSIVATQRAFRSHFNIMPRGRVPGRQSIVSWVKNFRETGDVKKKKPGLPRTARSPKNIDMVRLSVLQFPERSVRKHAAALGLSPRSVRRILQEELQFQPSKLTVVPELSSCNFVAKENACEAKTKELTEQIPNLMEDKEVEETQCQDDIKNNITTKSKRPVKLQDEENNEYTHSKIVHKLCSLSDESENYAAKKARTKADEKESTNDDRENMKTGKSALKVVNKKVEKIEEENDEKADLVPDVKLKKFIKSGIKRPSSKPGATQNEQEIRPKRRHSKKSSEDRNSTESTENEISFLNQTATLYDNISFECTKKNKLGEEYNLKISSWNVDGIRAWLKKDGLKYLDYEKPDILCLQETKCSIAKLPTEIHNIEGYKSYWCSSHKDGYAGVGLLTKIDPIRVENGMGDEDHDSDGRCITAEYENFYLITVYVPNAGKKLITLPKRLNWNEAFKAYIRKLDAKKPVIVCGDMNVAHKDIDLANPKTNSKNAGFTKEEREGMTDLLGDSYIDTFRHLYPEKKDVYTFWTYMVKARSRNVGWRLDYFILSKRISDKVCDNVIRNMVFGSNHCPITLFINI